MSSGLRTSLANQPDGPKGEASEQRRRGNLRSPETCGGEASIDTAVRDLVEDFLRLSAVARLFKVELESAAGELVDELGKLRRELGERRQMRAVDDGHDEAKGLGRNAKPRAQDK